MKSLKYLIEYMFVRIFYMIFRILGFHISSFVAGKIFKIYGVFSKRTSTALINIGDVIKEKNSKERKKIKTVYSSPLIWVIGS